MPLSPTQANLAKLEQDPRFITLRAKMIESLVIVEEEDDLPGQTYRGFYFDADDSSGVFQSKEEIDEYHSLLESARTER